MTRESKSARTHRKPRAADRKPRAADRLPGSVRIIGGLWRRRRIDLPDVEAVRPTPDRVRETLFNWLGQHLDGLCCLDLFAGTGVLGMEAASRGAKRVTLVDKHPVAVKTMRAMIGLLGAPQVRVVQADALEFLLKDPDVYDLVFLDPPFAAELPVDFLAALAPRLATGARVYVERDREFEPPAGWRVLRHGRAGTVHFHLIQVD